MSLTLDALTVLDAIDRRGSFASAADELHRVPSAVSYTVQKLEQDLDIAIFDRRGHRAVLTAAGKELLDEGRHLLQAAQHLENHVKRVATGWEAELGIAVDAIIHMRNILPLLEAFYAGNGGSTRLRIRREVLGGTWDALVAGRADLIIGGPGEAPAGGGYLTEPLGGVEMAFAVAPSHPLATEPEPIPSVTLLQHRAVAVADTSQNLAPRTAGLLTGQEVLTVADMESKLDAQRRGLGVGYLPLAWIQDDIATGRLVMKQVENNNHRATLFTAWRSEHKGKALKWFVEQLKQPDMKAKILEGT
jgi:DNA-binding transcriptional LysR family regulator